MKNRNTIKRLLALLLVLCTVLPMVTGCKQEPADPTADNTAPTGTESTVGSQPDPTDPQSTEPAVSPTEPEPPLDVTEPDPDPAEPMLHLYISTKGKDSNDGLTEKTALKSLDGASKMLMSSPFAGNITIHVAEGV